MLHKANGYKYNIRTSVGQRHVRVVWWLYNKISESLGIYFKNFWLAGWTDLKLSLSMKGELCFGEIDFSAASYSKVLSQEQMTIIGSAWVQGEDETSYVTCNATSETEDIWVSSRPQSSTSETQSGLHIYLILWVSPF